MHGASWSFGLGGVSHVGGDATAREIFPRLGGSQRPLPFWVAFGYGHEAVHHLALRKLGGRKRANRADLRENALPQRGDLKAAQGSVPEGTLSGLPQRASRSIGPLGRPMIRGGAAWASATMAGHPVQAVRIEGRPPAVDPEIPGNSSREPRMAWTVQEIIESCIKDRLTASLCPVAGFAGWQGRVGHARRREGWIDSTYLEPTSEGSGWALPGSRISSSERNAPGRQC